MAVGASAGAIYVVHNNKTGTSGFVHREGLVYVSCTRTGLVGWQGLCLAVCRRRGGKLVPYSLS